MLAWCVAVAFAEEPSESADDVYYAALGAWDHGRWQEALDGANRALEMDPDHAAARLLQAYALVKTGQPGVARERLVELSEDTGAPVEVRRRAAARARVFERKWTRDEAWLSGGIEWMTRTWWDQHPTATAPSLAAQVPIGRALAVRVSADRVPDQWFQEAPYGWRGAVLLSATHPIGKGAWHADISAGPAAWAARGPWWSDRRETFAGLRAGIGADVRVSPGAGFRFDLARAWFPGVSRDIPWYGDVVQGSVSMTVWLPAP
jgi:hypothetical protein